MSSSPLGDAPAASAALAGRPLRVVFASHTSMGGTFVIGSHHLAREVRRLGHEVVHVSTPVTAAHLIRLQDPEVRRRLRLAARPDRPDDVLNLVPSAVLPWSAKRRSPRLWALDLQLAPHRFRQGMQRRMSGPVDVLVIDQPKLVGLVELLRPRRTVYRATDLYATMKGNAGTADAERLVVEHADLVVATSRPVADHLASLGPVRPPVVLPNGVDQETFARPAPVPPEYLAEPSRARIVYVGSLDERFDFPTLDLVARSRPDVEVVVIGPMTSLSRERRVEPNVRFLGPRHHEQLPSYLQHAAAGLLLLGEHPSNAGRSPMKLYEYGASGLRVLARRTPELVRRDEPFVSLYDDPASALTGLARVLGDRPGLALPDPQRIRAMAWSGIAARLLSAALGTDGPQAAAPGGSPPVPR